MEAMEGYSVAENHNNFSFMAKYSAFHPYRLFRRETGFGLPIGAGDALATSLYCGMKPIASWDYEQTNSLPTGGVFNLEFSPEGTILVAACEKKSIQIFDPLTHLRIHSVNGAHSDCVNCVKFLDARMFATCSDDTTIALWDIRNLKKKIRSLHGHSNWVKNIEFSVKDKLLVTSGLDGSIYTWDINSYTESNLVYQRVFHASGLMRCRLSPNAKQMVMCTTGGLLVIIHDLNLTTLAQDLHGFKPNLYRLMQMSQQVIPIASMYDHLFDFKRKENRVEFVSDFPEGNDAEVVSSLQIHPQGWTALSRNISHDDRSEWSCIHDIQPLEPECDKSVRDSVPSGNRRPSTRRNPLRRTRPYRAHRAHPAPSNVASPPSSSGHLSSLQATAQLNRNEPVEPPAAEGEARASNARAGGDGGGVGLSSIQNDVWEASITIKQHRMLQEMYSRGQVGRNFNMQRIMGINTGIAPPAGLRVRHARLLRRIPPRERSPTLPASSTVPSTSGQTPPPREAPVTATATSTTSGASGTSTTAGASATVTTSSASATSTSPSYEDPPETTHYIRQNRSRLLYYIEETNEGKGFIKELCYSADGRVVCSPFGRGMRLLALNEDCSELHQRVYSLEGPAELQVVGQSLGQHQDLVVSTKFSPRYHLLVTGCLDGRIVWYEPFSGESLY